MHVTITLVHPHGVAATEVGLPRAAKDQWQRKGEMSHNLQHKLCSCEAYGMKPMYKKKKLPQFLIDGHRGTRALVHTVLANADIRTHRLSDALARTQTHNETHQNNRKYTKSIQRQTETHRNTNACIHMQTHRHVSDSDGTCSHEFTNLAVDTPKATLAPRPSTNVMLQA